MNLNEVNIYGIEPLMPLLCILVLFSTFSSPAAAQNSTSDESAMQIGLSTVYSPTSFEGWGKIRNGNSFSIKGQVWYFELSIGGLKPRLGTEIILTQHLYYPLNGVNGPRDQRMGFGFTPAKVLIPFGSSTVKPFTSFSAGFIFLNDKLPAIEGASFNYLLNAGAGVEISITEHVNFQLGYGLQHLSNGNSASLNPGIDFHNLIFTLVI